MVSTCQIVRQENIKESVKENVGNIPHIATCHFSSTNVKESVKENISNTPHVVTYCFSSTKIV